MRKEAKREVSTLPLQPIQSMNLWLIYREREQRMAQERLKKMSEEQNLLKQRKDQQQEFYKRFLKQTAEQNLKKIEEKQHQNVQRLINNQPLPQSAHQPQRGAPSKVIEECKAAADNRCASSKFQSRIPKPNFSGKQQSSSSIGGSGGETQAIEAVVFKQIAPATKAEEKRYIQNLNGLDLELSQTKRWQFDFKEPSSGKEPMGFGKGPAPLLERGDLIDSLDLNIGYESIQKLKDNWGFQKKLPDQSRLKAEPAYDRAVPKRKDAEADQEVEFDRDSLDGEDDQDYCKDADGGPEASSGLRADEMQILGGFKKDKKYQDPMMSNQEWLQASIRQSVAQWKDMLKVNKENRDCSNTVEQKAATKVPSTWIEQEFSKNQASTLLQEPPPVDPVVVQPIKAVDKEDEFTFGQKLELLEKQQVAQQMKPPKPASVQQARPGRGGQQVADDSKSTVSKVSRASSKSSRQLPPSAILSKEEEMKQAKEKKEKLDQIKKQYTQVSRQRSNSRGANSRKSARGGGVSPTGTTTKCTRDEDINIEEFMKDDLRMINKEEDKLQRELLNIHKQNLHKHHQVVTKNHIDTGIKNTEQLIRKMVNAPSSQQTDAGEQSLTSQGGTKRGGGLKRPGVDEGLEEQIEESLENLDNLLKNIKGGSTQQREQEIMRLGQKYNIDFNLSAACQAEQQNPILSGYGTRQQSTQAHQSKAQQPQQQQVFEYHQPFHVQSEKEKPSHGKSQEPQKPAEEAKKRPKQSVPQATQSAAPISGVHNEKQVTFGSQQQPGGAQFQPFQNFDVIANLYSQQQRLQQNINQLLILQQQQQQQQPVVSDPYSYQIGGSLPKQPQQVAGPAIGLGQQTYQQPEVVRCGKDMLRKRQQNSQQQHVGGATKAESSEGVEQMAASGCSIDFNQYNDYFDPNDIEDSLQQPPPQSKPTQQPKAPAGSSKAIAAGTDQSDKVKINPRFNMKILFDDD